MKTGTPMRYLPSDPLRPISVSSVPLWFVIFLVLTTGASPMSAAVVPSPVAAQTPVPTVVATAAITAAPTVAATPAPTIASPLEINAKATPAKVTIGTRFRYTLEVAAPAGVDVVLAQPAERIGDFEIVDFGDEPTAHRDGKTIVTRWFTLAGFTVGTHKLMSPPVYFRHGGKDLTEAPGKEITVTVESLLAKAGKATDIRDIRGPVEFPIDWRPYYFVGGALAALLGLAFALYRFLNRERRGAPAAAPKPAHVVALEELERLRRRGLVEQGAFKEYYSALSTIVRSYIERRFGLRAPEMTTEEFLLSSTRGGRLQSGHRGLLGEFLTESDMVKFARHVPTIADSERAFAAARRFVDETAAGVMSAPPSSPKEAIRAAG